MRRKLPDTRVAGVYHHGGGQFKVRYYVNGEEKHEYRKSKKEAEARKRELELLLEANKEIAQRSVGEAPEIEPGAGLTRGEWVSALWAQVRKCQEVATPEGRVSSLSAMAAAYKSVREDLTILEAGLAKPEDPSEMSDEDLDRKIIQLSRARGE